MYCKNCGNLLNQGEMFCGRCGTKVETNIVGENPFNQNIQNPTISNIKNLNNNINQNFNSNISNKKDRSKKNTISIVLGIVSLALVFILLVFIWPVSIVGIIFGILALKENKKYKIGLILNIISLVIAIPLFMVYTNIIDSKPSNPTVGTWDCKAFNNGYNDDLDYIITMTLNNDNQFKWNKYNDAKNNHVIGTYEFEDLHKTNYDETANYYQITLTGDEFVNNGELQSEVYKSTYEMGILKDTDEAILMNETTYNMYYCYRNDKSSSKIETSYSNNYDTTKGK